MEDKFSVRHVESNGNHYIFLGGHIDEDSRFDVVNGLSGNIIFNFKDVTLINSLGIRNWVNFIKTLSAKPVFYAECPPLIVRQLNMVPSFMGHAKVLSAFAPYVCDSCDNESAVLLEEKAFGTLEEVIKCQKCGKEENELDGHPQQYFAFAK